MITEIAGRIELEDICLMWFRSFFGVSTMMLALAQNVKLKIRLTLTTICERKVDTNQAVRQSFIRKKQKLFDDSLSELREIDKTHLNTYLINNKCMREVPVS